MLEFKYEQDGNIAESDVIDYFELSNEELRINKKIAYYNFVGFVFKNDKMLMMFPKHYVDSENKIENIENDAKLLFNTIKKYNNQNKVKANAKKYYGNEINYDSDYPFEQFFKIYDYYKKFGLYKDEQSVIKENVNTKISWKETINKANIVVSNKNLIFLPLFSKIKNSKDTFIGECMSFVINNTIRNFPMFFDIKPISGIKINFNFLENKDYVIKQLYQYKNAIFKDNQKKLIDSLIEFFENYNCNPKGGAIHIRIDYFNLIWESMVNNYLNNNFVSVDKENSKLIFSNTKLESKNGFKPKTFNIDVSDNKFNIRPDHYYEKENDVFVFDSKYYMDINEMNYKQFSYTILLGNSQLGSQKNLYSALLLPGISKKSKFHLKLNIPYCQLNPGCNYIIEEFLNVKNLMINYMDNN